MQTDKDSESNLEPFAPEYELPDREFVVVEYPGVIRNLDRAIVTLGGMATINKLYSEEDSSWELSPRPENPFSHPIVGRMVKSRNFVLKITRRVRRRKNKGDGDQPELLSLHGEIVGSINQTVRFRAMSDFQYQPQGSKVMMYQQLLHAIKTKDITALSEFQPQDYQDDPPTLLPPPLFSTYSTPFQYKYGQNYGLNKVLAKQDRNAASYQISFQILNQKPDQCDFITWNFVDPEVPSEPKPEYLTTDLPSALLDQARKLFEERPMWTRLAISHKLGSPQAKLTRQIIRIFAYRVGTGPWHDNWARYGFDPRLDPESRRFQVLGFRKSHLDISECRVRTTPTGPEPYIFSPPRPPLAQQFQICDIRYPRIDKYVNDTANLCKAPTLQYGWFQKPVYRRIHDILYDKYHFLLDQQRAGATKKAGHSGVPLAWNRLSILPRRRKTRLSDDNQSDTDVETLISNHTTELMSPAARRHPATPAVPAFSLTSPSDGGTLSNEFNSQLSDIQDSLHSLIAGAHRGEEGEYEDESEFEYYDGHSESDDVDPFDEP